MKGETLKEECARKHEPSREVSVNGCGGDGEAWRCRIEEGIVPKLAGESAFRTDWVEKNLGESKQIQGNPSKSKLFFSGREAFIQRVQNMHTPKPRLRLSQQWTHCVCDDGHVGATNGWEPANSKLQAHGARRRSPVAGCLGMG